MSTFFWARFFLVFQLINSTISTNTIFVIVNKALNVIIFLTSAQFVYPLK